MIILVIISVMVIFLIAELVAALFTGNPRFIIAIPITFAIMAGYVWMAKYFGILE